MKILNFIRYIAWLGIESFKADSIIKHLSQIKRSMSDDKYYREHLDFQLKKLLQYSTQHVNYYRLYHVGDTFRLEDFPIIDKNLLMDRPTDFQSDAYSHEHLHEMSTSGSTGRPFKITQNLQKT